MTTDSAWQVTSSTRRSGALAAGVLLLGLLFLWLTRHATPGDANLAAARWLGVLLASIGIAGLVLLEEVVTTVDAAGRRLVIERRTRWSRRRTVIPFARVDAVRVVKLGSTRDGTPSYWLQVLDRTGRSHATGLWSLDEAETGLAGERLAAEVGCRCHRGPARQALPAGALQVAAAALVALVAYAGWYRVSVGPWCPAMWFGTAPPLFMLGAFSAVLAMLRRCWR